MSAVSNLILLEHVNLELPISSADAARSLYSALGFSADPRTALRNNLHWANAGLCQIHLPLRENKTSCDFVPGELGIGVAAGSLPAHSAALTAAGIPALADSSGELRIPAKSALGTAMRLVEVPGAAAGKWLGGHAGCRGQPLPLTGIPPASVAALGLRYVAVRTPPSELKAVADFWRDIIGARVDESVAGRVRVLADGWAASEDAGGAAPGASDSLRGGQWLDFFASDDSTQLSENTWHAAIYLRDFAGAWQRAHAAGLLFDNARFSDRVGTWAQAQEHAQFRTLRMQKDGGTMLMELEIRSTSHPACPLAPAAAMPPPPSVFSNDPLAAMTPLQAQAQAPRGVVTPADVAFFREHGYVVLRGFCSPAELASVAALTEAFFSRELPVPGKDWGEHTPGLLNVTAFALYYPDFSKLGDGVLAALDARALAATRALYGEDSNAPPASSSFARDYEQLLRKLPARPSALFPSHQDIAYWPRSASGAFDTRTATVSLAVNCADEKNGCLWVIPGSHAQRALHSGSLSRRADSRPDGGGVIELALTDEELSHRVFLPLAPGDVSIHDEWLVHGSEGNAHPNASRDTLILAYRARSMIAVERSLGFRHSYNDGDDVLRRVRDSTCL